MSFHKISKKVAKQFTEMSKTELFLLNIDKTALWEHYLASFPEGSNPIYRERTEHDCQCCRSFITNLGRVVSIKNGKFVSVWDIDTAGLPEYLAVVAKAMSEFVLKNPQVSGVYRTEMRNYGQEETLENDGGTIVKWNHFHGEISQHHRSGSPEAVAGSLNALYHVAGRSLKELTVEAVEDVLGLISENNLYRGAEFKKTLEDFLRVKKKFDALGGDKQKQNVFIWDLTFPQRSAIRNSAIGTLLVDLSAGVDLDTAVHSFEKKLDPTSYNRPRSVATPAMVKAAATTVRSLGYEEALQRRLANISDIEVKDVLWAGSEMHSPEEGSFLDSVVTASETGAVDLKKATPISVEKFFEKVAPKAGKLEVFVEGKHQKNFVSLTAPVIKNVPSMFNWDNGFGWSYSGNITDSITERVEKAGGDVNARLRFSLAWHNGDDLDLHSHTPHGHTYFGNKQSILDVDMNAMGVKNSVNPVENQAFRNPIDGTYEIVVHNFSARSRDNVGFVLQVVDENGVQEYTYPIAVPNKEKVNFVFTVKNGVATLRHKPFNAVSGGVSSEKWGITTNQFVNVRAVMNSPNHWGANEVGHKHWIFALQGCETDENTRGLYNEFLKQELREHRKAFEMISSKSLCGKTKEPLCGVGFAQAKDEKIIVRVDGKQMYLLEV